jgi:alpha-beta hydrolase superfamily lysophospholipase
MNLNTTTLPEPQTLSFYADNLCLVGTLHMPRVSRPPVVVGLHGLLSNRHSPKQIELARCCCERGLAYFRFDHRGRGDSDGRLEKDTSLASRCRDVEAALKMLRSRDDILSRLALFGSSMGGAVALAIAAREPIATVVTVAAPINSKGVIEMIGALPPPAHMPPIFFEPRFQFDISALIGNIHHLLLFHGEKDEVVPLSHAYEILNRARFPKKLVVQKGGDHRMSSPAHQQRFLDEATAWFVRALQPTRPDSTRHKPGLS